MKKRSIRGFWLSLLIPLEYTMDGVFQSGSCVEFDTWMGWVDKYHLNTVVTCPVLAQ